MGEISALAARSPGASLVDEGFYIYAFQYGEGVLPGCDEIPSRLIDKDKVGLVDSYAELRP